MPEYTCILRQCRRSVALPDVYTVTRPSGPIIARFRHIHAAAEPICQRWIAELYAEYGSLKADRLYRSTRWVTSSVPVPMAYRCTFTLRSGPDEQNPRTAPLKLKLRVLANDFEGALEAMYHLSAEDIERILTKEKTP